MDLKMDFHFYTSSDDDHGKYESLYYISIVVGYIYTIAWGVSFLGQIFLNYKLKNVQGCNLDFVIYNFTGFCFYAAYNIAGYVQPEKSGIGQVKLNDLIFACWSLGMTIITLSQCIYYPKLNNKVSLICKIATPIYWIFIITYVILEYGADVFTASSEYYNAWYMMSYVKLWISLTKYMPQAYWNYKRKSTEGWSIFNIILDFTGGSFSFAQMAIDAANGTDHTFDTGSGQGLNVAKFGLSVISIFFDIIFMIQHYVLYNPKNKPLPQGKELEDEASLTEPFQQKVVDNENSMFQNYESTARPNNLQN